MSEPWLPRSWGEAQPAPMAPEPACCCCKAAGSAVDLFGVQHWPASRLMSVRVPAARLMSVRVPAARLMSLRVPAGQRGSAWRLPVAKCSGELREGEWDEEAAEA